MAVNRRKRHSRKPKPRVVIDYPPVPTRKWIPPDQRPRKPKPPPKYVKPEGITQKLAISSLRKVWNQFLYIYDIPTLIGHYSQTHKKYTVKTNGYQGACNCAVACVYAYLKPMHTWSRYTLDEILNLGDNLYIKTITQPMEKCLVEVPPEKVFNSIFLGWEKITFVIEEKTKVVDKLTAVGEEKVKATFEGALTRFFKMFPSGIFVLLKKCVAIWINEDTWYLFDPTEHDEYGDPWKGVYGWGYSSLYRCKSMGELVYCLYKNMNTRIPHTKFEIYGCTVQRIVQINICPPDSLDEVMAHHFKEASGGDMEDTKEEVPEDTMAYKLEEYVKEVEEGEEEEEEKQMKAIKALVLEISPNAIVDPVAERRPTWLPEGTEIDKVDVCRFGVPTKPKPEKLTYYLELVPKTMGILRAGTSQTDPRLTKYLGRQSMGNAISALTMLRFHKSKVWVPKILNTILKYGDHLYRDAMITIPRTQSLKLSNFQKKTEYEGRNFMPVVEDFVVIGRLQSKDFEVLDLCPALETFLTDHECCVIIGPLTLAVWVEDGRYYMFDPNERDKNGETITKSEYVGSVLVPLEYTPGVACVTWFAHLKDLVALYMKNVEKPKKMDPFYLSKVEITDYVEVPDAWYNFKGIVPGKWILRGTVAQCSKKYSKESRNFQSPACCLVAIAKQYLLPMKDWETETVDEVLDLGDKFYNETLAALNEKSIFQTKMLMMNELNPTFEMMSKEAAFTVDECIVNGSLNTKDGYGLLGLSDALEMFFKDNDRGIVAVRNISVAVWKFEGFYYYFDSHSRDENGLVIGYGTACVIRAQLISDLANAIETNLTAGYENVFNIHRITIAFYDVGSGAAKSPLNYFKAIDEDSAILRSLFSEKSTKYDINCGKQTVPMCLTALAYNKLKPVKEWDQKDIDEVLNKGNKLYADTMAEILQKEEREALLNEVTAFSPKTAEGQAMTEKVSVATTATTATAGTAGTTGSSPEGFEDEEVEEDDGILKLEQMNNELTLGLNKFTFEVEPYPIEECENGGDNIRQHLQTVLACVYEKEQTEEYFNQEIILESKPVSLAIWRDDRRWYVFDPMPRDNSGLVYGMEDWSEVEDEELEEENEFDEAEGGEREETEEVRNAGDEGEFEEEAAVQFEPDEGGGGDQVKLASDAAEGAKLEEDQMFQFAEAQEEGRAEEGIVYIKPLRKSSSFWREQEKQGKACVVLFTKMSNMINHVFSKVPPKVARNETFRINLINIKNSVLLKDILRSEAEREDVYGGDWYFFKEIEHGTWILRGEMNMWNELFPEKNRGKQMLAMCIAAIAVYDIFTIICFNDDTVDNILRYGDKLHSFMKRTRKKELLGMADKKLNEDEIDWLLDHEDFTFTDIPKKICMSYFMVHITIEPNVVVGDITALDEDPEVLSITKGISTFFDVASAGILECKDLMVAVWRGSKTYYMMDCKNRGPNGIVAQNGTACVLRTLGVEKLSQVFLQNLPKHGNNSFYIHKVIMKKDLCPRQREPKKLAEPRLAVTSGGFVSIMPGKSIIRGSIHQEDPKFGKGPFVMSAPIAFIALTMSLIHKCNTWSKPIVDDVIELGAQLYEETLYTLDLEFNPWEEKLDIYRVNNDFCVGVLKANLELRHTVQKGIIDAKDENITNLRQGIEMFFEENTHGIIVTDPLVLAIWEEEQDGGEPLILIYDPNPRGPMGMPLFTGTACMVTFVNAAMAAEHIIACILEPEKRMGEFTIVPVEIVVGRMRTCPKIKKTPTRSSIGVLSRCSKLAADEEKRTLRRIAEMERRKKEARRRQLLGRRCWYLLKAGDAIIRGYRSQNSKQYCEESRNNQDIPNCMVCIVMHHLIPVENWNAKHVDLILDIGDQLYIDSYIAYGPKDPKLGMRNIMRKFYFRNISIHATIYKPIITEEFIPPVLNRVLNVYFQQEPFCLLNFENQWVAIIFKSGLFYLFDPHERDIEGYVPKKDDKDVSAVLLRFTTVERLSDRIIDNFFSGEEEEVEGEEGRKMFTLWLISVDIR